MSTVVANNVQQASIQNQLDNIHINIISDVPYRKTTVTIKIGVLSCKGLESLIDTIYSN